MSDTDAASFGAVGAALFRSALNGHQIERVRALFGPADRPGKRLGRADVEPVVDMIAGSGPIGQTAVSLLGQGAVPVRALLLDKSEAVNWRLGWHQDRTIAVRERIDVPGFALWSVKAGQLHVQPPECVTAAMVTLRIHADDVCIDNAPLEILPGSHLLGRLSNEQIEQLAGEWGAIVCTAQSGDIWGYSTGTVHASSEQRGAQRRRVLQIDYSAQPLPGGLEWAALA